MSARELADRAKGLLYGSDGASAADLIEELVDRCEQAEAALRHVWGCPYEPFACSNPLHATATRLVREAGT